MAPKKKSAVDWFAERTSMHGVPSLVKSKSSKSRLFWTLVCMIGMGMFFFMLVSLITKYLTFPVVVKIIEVPKGITLPKISFCNNRYASIVSELAFARWVKEGGIVDLDLDPKLESAVQDFYNLTHSLYRLKDALDTFGALDRNTTSLSESDLTLLEEWAEVREDLDERWMVTTLLFKKGNTIKDQLRNLALMRGGFPDSVTSCTYTNRKCKSMTFFSIMDHLCCYTYDPTEGHIMTEGNVQGIKNGVTFVFFTGTKLIASEFGTDRLWLIPGYKNIYHTSSGSDGMRIVIHNPTTAPSPMLDGIDIEPGMSTLIGVTSTENNRLEEPYGDCVTTDIEEDLLLKSLEAKLGYRPTKGKGIMSSDYSVIQCRSSCLQRYFWEECGCLVPSEKLPFFNSSLICGYFDTHVLENADKYGLESCFKLENIPTPECKSLLEKLFTDLKCVRRVIEMQDNVHEENEEDFSCNCPFACVSREYDTVISGSKWPGAGPELDAAYKSIVTDTVIPYFRNMNTSLNKGPLEYLANASNRYEIMENFARVTVYIKSMRVRKVQHIKAYTFVDLISDIGGQLGLWVGISAITLCEIFGFLTLSMRHVFNCSEKEKNEDDEDQEERDATQKMF